MAITLNHTIVPAHDKEAAARLFARLFGLTYKGAGEHFTSVKVNDTLTFLFDDATMISAAIDILGHGAGGAYGA